MNGKETEKAPIVVSKSFMAVGPTLHYSHKNVLICWLLALAAFGVSCVFWSKIVSDTFWSFDAQTVANPALWRLGRSITTGVSIFEYPWQILVLGLLMGVLAVVPVLISQLMSFRYSIPLILQIFVFANLPAFAICVLLSCIAVACRPLRFRSRFIAIALCAAPQLLYWGYFGPARGVEPIKWGVSFTPWICAWLDAMIISGFVLGIGHFTRYRPGLTWIFTTLTLVIAVVIFEKAIGFDELGYNLYVAENNPEHVSAFHDRKITEALDRTMQDADTKELLDELFYPSDPIERRAELKTEIQKQLRNDSWPSWFIAPPELEYKQRKEELLKQYELFTTKHPTSRRMPTALYYKAMLTEYNPDPQLIGQEELLRFYSDHPHERAKKIWWQLCRDFGTSPESLEARWRMAKHLAGRGIFEDSDELLAEAQSMLTAVQAKLLEAEQTPPGGLFGLFRAPAYSAMTTRKLSELQRRLDQLQLLISSENRTQEPGSIERLAKFVMLNPHALDYAQHLDGLLEQTEAEDKLRDNILLAQAKLAADEHRRAEKLDELRKEYDKTDGGMLALYELGLLKISMWHQENQSNTELKKQHLKQAREYLEDFIKSYPNSFYTGQVQKNLDNLPAD
ncbi:MAG: tetratricopeptide repeat protein [Planctomycetota bacterium]|jgi:outer membrane protein assembly factor BamD (BamD/ComL family)